MASTWDDICKSVDSFAKKAGRKVEQLTEEAAIRLKISAKKAEMEDAYLELGKLTFEQINSESADDATDCDPIADKVAEIKALQEEIEKLQQKIATETQDEE
jgi:hypothetical protein